MLNVSLSRSRKLFTICRVIYNYGFEHSLRVPNKFKKSYSTISSFEFIISDKAIQSFLNITSTNVISHPEGETNGIENSYLCKLFRSRNDIRESLCTLEEMNSEKLRDEELKNQIEEEKRIYSDELMGIEFQLIEALSPKQCISSFNGIILEITAGVGGQEAMLFTKELFEMYSLYLNAKGWDFYTSGIDSTDLGGVRHTSIVVNSIAAYRYLQYESGVHRVQRIPATEKSGRVHTSTVTVAVLPQPREVDVQLCDKDLIIETKRASGAGGQHVNTTDSAVRITHIPTGVVSECQTERSQIKNKEIALLKLRTKLYQQVLDKQSNELFSLRKLQVGTSSRSDKVRTYNFNQDRITDHRLGKNFHNLPDFLKGGSGLDCVITSLASKFEKEMLHSFINDIRIKDKLL